MKKLSIVVPVYNVEKYLDECIMSLLCQTYPNLEIILVNDGSTDKSYSICMGYKEKDNRVKVLNQQNGGLSHARNSGINVATGDYITFVDSDDFIVSNYSDIIMENMMSRNLDLLIFGVYRQENKSVSKWIGEMDSGYYPKDAILGMTLKGINTNISACNKCYKTENIKRLMFKEGIKFEDYYMTPEIFNISERIYYLNSQLYYYRVNPQSIMSLTKKVVSTDIVLVTNYVLDKIYQLYGREVLNDNLWACINRAWRWVPSVYRSNNVRDNQKFLLEIHNMLISNWRIIKADKNIRIIDKVRVLLFIKNKKCFFYLEKVAYILNRIRK